MNGKILLLLVVVAALAVFAAYRLNQPQPAAGTAATGAALLYPDLRENLNAVKTIRISGPGNALIAELANRDSGWVTVNKGDYPAAFGKIRTLLLALADATIVEQKTANPELYGRLGVADISSEAADGRLLELKSENDSWALIVGNAASGGGAGTYVRRAGENASLLIGNALNVAGEASDWLQQPLLNIPGDRVQRATVRHANGETVTLLKENRSDENFTLFNLLAGRELSYDTVANPTGHGISNLDLDDVLPRDQLKIPEQTTTAEYYTFDGLKISVELFNQDDTNYALLSAAFDEEQAQRFAPAADENENADEKEESGAGESEENDEDSDVGAEAAALNARLAPWAFVISDFKYRNMSKTLEDFLKPAAEEAGSDEAAPETPANELPVENNAPAAGASEPAAD